MPIKNIKIPKKDVFLAEFVGIMLGDGNIYCSKEKGVYQIKVTNNSETDKEYLLNYVRPLAKKLFGVDGTISFDKNRKGINLRIAGIELFKFLLSIGLVEGDKIINEVTIPKWVKENNVLLIACLRGLFDTDGTIFQANKIRYPKRLNIGFKNNNKKLLFEVRDSLISLGFHPTNTKRNAIFLCRSNEIKLFMKNIGFSNIKHSSKYYNNL
ncbi:MAG: LAGLIDADG family homing endonuclease [Nanoarchaeota archaeon]